MSGGVCHLCFEGSQYMKSDFQQSLQNSESQEFFEFFCQFMFNVSIFICVWIHSQWRGD